MKIALNIHFAGVRFFQGLHVGRLITEILFHKEYIAEKKIKKVKYSDSTIRD